MTISIKPTASGSTIEQDGSTILTVDGSGNITAANNFSATGHVLQVVSTTKTDTFSTNSTSFTNVTGLNASITPLSASSKIMIFVSIMVSRDPGTDAHTIFTAIAGGNTASYIGNTSSNRIRTVTASRHTNANSNIANLMVPVSMQYLDTPNTTSSTTYNVQVRNSTSSGAGYVNMSGEDSDSSAFGRGASTITLMEIAG